MALPPKGDPRRPLHLAIRSTRSLGIVLILLGSLVLLVGLVLTQSRLLVVVSIIYMSPGIGFLVIAIFLKRRATWAVTAGIVLASLTGLFALLALVGSVVGLARSPRGASTPDLVALGIVVLVVLAVAQLILHLAKSYESIRTAEPEVRGFEPIAVGTPRHENQEI